jgi:hypothetical protein
MTDTFATFVVERVTPQYWRVTFDRGPINTVNAEMVAELSELVDAIESDERLAVVVFTSHNPEFFLARYDTEGDPAKTLDKQAIGETKAFVDATTLPADAELPPALTAFFASFGRPGDASPAREPREPRLRPRQRDRAQAGRARHACDTARSAKPTRGGTTSTTQTTDVATEASAGATVPLRFEVTVVPVADVDRAKGFYQRLGWRLDDASEAVDRYMADAENVVVASG